MSELSDLHGVREAARRDKRTRFISLLHVTVQRLRDSYYALKREAAPGVNGVTWQEYGTDLDEKLADFIAASIGERTERNHPSEPTYQKQMGGNVSWASQPWRISWSSRRW